MWRLRYTKYTNFPDDIHVVDPPTGCAYLFLEAHFARASGDPGAEAIAREAMEASLKYAKAAKEAVPDFAAYVRRAGREYARPGGRAVSKRCSPCAKVRMVETNRREVARLSGGSWRPSTRAFGGR